MDWQHALVHWGLLVLAALLSLVLTLAFLRGAARLPTFLSLAIIAVTFVVLV